MRTALVSLIGCACLGFLSSTAAAETEPRANAPPVVVAGAPAPAAPAEDGAKDGVRFRFGVAVGGGAFFADKFTAGLGGLDIRLGVQINNYLGVYAQPHLSFGAATVNNISGGTGVAGGSALVDLTLFNRMFVGAGGGGGVINNPAGPMLHFRLGGYPIMGLGENGYRRKGLMVGADVRIYFVTNGAASLTVIQPMFMVGYEAF